MVMFIGRKMKRRVAGILLFGFISLPAFSFFEDFGRDARARGMANAIVALYGDVHSIHYNPAGTARTKNLELNLIYSKPMTWGDLNDGSGINNFSGSLLMPFTNGLNTSWIIRWLFHALTWGNEAFMFKNGAMGISVDYTDITVGGSLPVKQTQITLNYSKIMDDVLFKGAKLSFGFNFDFYLLGFSSNDDSAANASIDKTSNFAFGLDLGIIYNFSENFTLAVVFENLVKPDFSFFDDGLGDDVSPMNLKLGGSIYFNKLLFFEDLTLNLMYVKYGKYDDDDNTVASISWHFGFESWWFKRHFGFRAGFMLGDDDMNEFSTGITLLLPLGRHFLSIDYAFTLPIAGVETTRHIMALTWKWEQPKWRFEYDKKKAAEMRRIAELEAKQRKQNAAGGNSSSTNTSPGSGTKKKDK